MARKITLSFLNTDKAKTVGLSLREFAVQLNLWHDRTDVEINNLLQNGLDTTKYQLSWVWFGGDKTARVFLKGYSIQEQLDTIMEELAGDGSQDVAISFFDLLPHVKFRFEVNFVEQKDDDLWWTILQNINPKWLGSLTDKNSLSSHIGDAELRGTLPNLPSAEGQVFRVGFDTDMVVPKTLID